MCKIYKLYFCKGLYDLISTLRSYGNLSITADNTSYEEMGPKPGTYIYDEVTDFQKLSK